jgi:hypothetical protein
MKKMGGTVCDICRVLLRSDQIYAERHTKKAHVMHFCSAKCLEKDTPMKTPIKCTVAQKCEYDDVLAIVTDIYMSRKTAEAWMNTKNLNFGGCSPKELILRDKGNKVREFIQNNLGSGAV